MAARPRTDEAQRIISLAPSVTSILLALGAQRQLVGVTKWCKDVANTGRRPEVGDCWKADIDDIMALEPTLLIGSVPFAAETVSLILNRPVAFLALNPRSIADIEANILMLARLIDRPVRARGLIREMRQAFRAISRRSQAFRHQPKPRVYCEAWPNPRISSPPWVSELVNLAGGSSVVKPGAGITDEEVAQAQPDVIVLAWAATGDRAKARQALSNLAWKDVPAVKMGRVVVIRDEILNTPGPPLVKGACALFDAIHAGQPGGRTL